jgi:transposase InsO family protein
MEYLETGRRHRPNATPKERDSIWHQARGYRFENGVLYKRTSDGTEKVVPRPEHHANLIRRVHQDVDHYGVKKTYSLLEPTYWWVGMFGQVQHEVAACIVCDRAKASFKVKNPQLKPLPIMGMFYRWGVDLCKMPVTFKDGNNYVIVMIEHFTKWVEHVPIPKKSSKYTAEALKRVLTMFGAPAEVLIDQGEEFEEEFAELLESLLIDHRVTSRNHPQSDGLAERMVQTIKAALRG